MSELIELAKSLFPVGCQDCPLLGAYMVFAETSEQMASREYEPLLNLISMPVEPAELNSLLIRIHTIILEMADEAELDYTKKVDLLAQYAQDCPGSKRGAPQYGSILWKIEAYIKGVRICRNPRMQEFMSAVAINETLN